MPPLFPAFLPDEDDESLSPLDLVNGEARSDWSDSAGFPYSYDFSLDFTREISSSPVDEWEHDGKRQVSFCDEATQIHWIEPRTGMTREEREVCWYTRKEYKNIRERDWLIVQLMAVGAFEESDQHSCRGLEHRLPMADQLTGVLLNVQNQHIKRKTDVLEELLATTSENMSKQARKRAEWFGYQDSLVSMECWKEQRANSHNSHVDGLAIESDQIENRTPFPNNLKKPVSLRYKFPFRSMRRVLQRRNKSTVSM